MSDWTDGYVSEIGYTYGYYAELNPARSQLALLTTGLEPPVIRNACELGFGQGISVNFHAAGNNSTAWFGTDFNPSQAGFAQSLANVSGAKPHLFDQSFVEFCQRDDLPEFDYIGIHGIWSWISDENRQVIVDFISRKLAVGGILYISYNTLPGWSTAAPLRHLMTQHAETMTGAGQGIVNQVDAALKFTQQLVDSQPNYVSANPQIPERFKHINAQNRSYLAHEYFNKDWRPMYFSEMAEWLEPAKLTFACSTHYIDHIDILNLTEPQQKLLASIPDQTFRQTVRDFMVNQQFRRDCWVKGPRKLDAFRQQALVRNQRVMLVSHRADIVLSVSGGRGEANLNESVYGPILDALADHQVKTIAQLEAAIQGTGITFAQLIQSLMILAGIGHVYTVHEDAITKASRQAAQQLNREVIEISKSTDDLGCLVSPVTGGGIPVPRFQQLFLLAIEQGKKQPKEWAEYVWDILALQGQSILKDGKPLTTPQENLAELMQQATTFAEKQLKILTALQITQ